MAESNVSAWGYWWVLVAGDRSLALDGKGRPVIFASKREAERSELRGSDLVARVEIQEVPR